MPQDNDLIKFPRTVTVMQVAKAFPVLDGEYRIPHSLTQAQQYAGKEGFVFTSEDLIRARIDLVKTQGKKATNHPFLDKWYTVLTEECRIGNDILVFQGGFVFNEPKRIKQALDKGLVEGAGKYMGGGITLLKEGIGKGRIPDTNIQVINYVDFKKLSEKDILGLLKHYGVVLSIKEATQLSSGYHDLSSLVRNPLFTVRSGGIEQANEHVETLSKLGAESFGNYHNFIDGAGRLLYVRYNFNGGFGCYSHLDGDARFVGVDQSAEGASPEILPVKPDITMEIAALRELASNLEALCK